MDTEKSGWYIDLHFASLKFSTGESGSEMSTGIKVGITLVLLGVATVLLSGDTPTFRQ